MGRIIFLLLLLQSCSQDIAPKIPKGRYAAKVEHTEGLVRRRDGKVQFYDSTQWVDLPVFHSGQKPTYCDACVTLELIQGWKGVIEKIQKDSL